MSAIAEAATAPELHVGLVAGALAAGAVAAVRPLRRAPVAVVTAAMAVATAWSLTDVWWAVLGVAALAAAAAGPATRSAFALLAVGILSLAVSAPSVAAGVFLAAMVVVAAPALGEVTVARGPALAAALLAVSVAGIWASVPDTEEILLFGGALALPLLVTVASGLDQLDVGWTLATTAAVVGPVLWAAVLGGRGRPGSMVGGVACLGLLLVEPLARRITRTTDSTRTPAALVGVLLVVQVAVVTTTARVAAAYAAVAPAVLVSTGALVTALAVVSLALIATGQR